ncbi:MAG: asparagine synthase (glutamine-hydrolyzing) [Candidatus Helarchaeota archaeon]
MCGICGEYTFNLNERVKLENIKRMTRTMVHRGPDDEGFYIGNVIGLGFRRLSIIDLKSGRQPMSDSENKVWVVCNGEIYNFPEIKKELENYGHIFRTKSDTEVIVYGYKQWGSEVLNHLNGMFGLAIWDKEKKKLILARDRLGIKPLYYQIDDNRIIFGSEIRALQANNNRKNQISPLSLNQFLRYRFVPAPRTLFEGIKKLAPGTMLIVKNGKYRIKRWWRFKPILFDPIPGLEKAEEELFSLYLNAIKRQLISDVPVGLLLSGGLDSGLIAGILSRIGSYIKTYTIGFAGDFKKNELQSAKYTAELFGLENFSVELDKNTFINSLLKIISFTEEPIASPSIVPMYYVSKRARQDVKVVLTGQGPDEYISGYNRHIAIRYGHFWRKVPGFARNLLKKSLRQLMKSEAIYRGLYSLDEKEIASRYELVLSISSIDEVDRLFLKGILSEGRKEELISFWEEFLPVIEKTDELGGFHFFELSSSLPEEQLIYGDKMSMAHGLEARVPFLDHEIVEYVTRLPESYKVRWFKRKWIHKRICKKVLPKEVINRKKIGFETPVNEWFHQSMNSELNKILLDPKAKIYEYLDHSKVCRLVTQHLNGLKDNHKILFSLVVSELCMRI